MRASVQTTTKAESGAPASHLVATLLVQKEEELKQLTAPGQMPPRAAIVAGMRKEIASLRAQLKSAVAANLPPMLAADLPIPPSFPSSASTTTAAAIPTTTASPGSTLGSASVSTPSSAMLSSKNTATGSTSTAGSRNNKNSAANARSIAGREALLLVEQQLSVASSGSGSESDEDLGARARTALYAVEQSLSMGVVNFARAAETEELAELEALQQENILLKQRLEALKEYQRKLEVLKEQASVDKQAEEEEKKKKKIEKSEPAAAPSEGAPVEKKKRAPRKTATKKPSVAEAGVDGEDATTAEVKPRVRRTTTTRRKKVEGEGSSSSDEGETAAKVTRKTATKKTTVAAVAPEEEAAALQNIVNVFL